MSRNLGGTTHSLIKPSGGPALVRRRNLFGFGACWGDGRSGKYNCESQPRQDDYESSRGYACESSLGRATASPAEAVAVRGG